MTGDPAPGRTCLGLWLGALLTLALLGLSASGLALVLLRAVLVAQLSLASAATVELIREASRQAQLREQP